MEGHICSQDDIPELRLEIFHVMFWCRASRQSRRFDVVSSPLINAEALTDAQAGLQIKRASQGSFKCGSCFLGSGEPVKVLEKIEGIEHKFCVWGILTVVAGIGGGKYSN